MAESLGANLQERIREILEASDLTTLSSKQVRLQLQEEFKVDLSSKKDEIDAFILDVLPEITDQKAQEKEKKEKKEKKENGHSVAKAKVSKEAKPSPVKKVSAAPDKKSKFKSSDIIDDDMPDADDSETIRPGETDEEFALRLQNELKPRTRNRNAPPPRQAPKKPRKPKEDDDGKVKNTGIHAPVMVSEVLAQVLGTNETSRPQAVKLIWVYVKENNLQDPDDKRFIRCDDKLQAVFGKPRVSMFGMNKILSSHLKRKDEIVP